MEITATERCSIFWKATWKLVIPGYLHEQSNALLWPSPGSPQAAQGSDRAAGVSVLLEVALTAPALPLLLAAAFAATHYKTFFVTVFRQN